MGLVEAKGLGSLLTRTWDALKSVFVRGTDTRAEVIAELEASEAVHGGSIEAVEVATAGLPTKPHKLWLVDGAPCEICIGNRDAGPIPLGQPFPSGANWPPQHPRCLCSTEIVDVVVATTTKYGRSSVVAGYEDGVDPASAQALAVRLLARDVLGLSMKDAMARISSLVGAPDGSTVTVSVGGDDILRVSVTHADFHADRAIYRHEGAIVIENSSFMVNRDAQGKGLGAEVFGRQVEQAIEAGVTTIVTEAARSKSLNGYYTWARFGYDADIQEFIRARLLAEFRDAVRVSDLMKTAEGRAAWKEFGGTTEMEFDLREGSLSRKVWDAYREEKAAR